MAADDYGIVVGLARYPKIGDLQGPENDARAFYDWLISLTGGAVPEDRVKLILSSDFPETDDPIKAQPTQSQVLTEFDRLVEAGVEGDCRRLGRRLYIYLAGHGLSQDLRESALLMANASDWRKPHIRGWHSAEYFQTAGFFEEIVLFMDCCRDDYPRVKPYVPAWPENCRSGQNVRYFYGFATKWSRKAREKEVEAGGEIRGLFTRVLLEAFDRAEPDEQGRITGTGVANYVFNQLPKLLDSDEIQEPEFDWPRRRDVVFVERAAADELESVSLPTMTPVRILPAATLIGTELEVLGPELKPVTSQVAGSAPWEVQLSAGLYLLQTPDKSKRKVFEVIGQEAIDVGFG